MAQSVIGQGIKVFAVDLLGGLLGFPLWWYTKGLARFARFAWQWFQDYRAWLGVSIWVKNLFVPMYGSYDIVGRIVSFFMRLVMIVLRSIGLVITAVFFAVVLLLYILLPAAVTVMILYHGFGLTMPSTIGL